MHADHDDSFRDIEAAISARLRSLNSTGDAGNGTPLADALATILAADAVQAGVAPAAVASLTADELVAAAKIAEDLLLGETLLWSKLPFGTVARELQPGEVVVGDQYYVLLDTRRGMMQAHEAPASQSGPNLDLLRRQLSSTTAGRAWNRLGQPEAVVDDGTVDEHLLRFAPCASAGGVSLEVPLRHPINQSPHCSFDEIIQQTSAAMEIFWRQRREIADRARLARSVFESEAAVAGPAANHLAVAELTSRPFEFVDKDGQIIDDKLSLYLGLTNYDAALRPSVAHYMMFSMGRDKLAMRNAIERHFRISLRVGRGEPPLIDDLAATIAMAAPEGLKAVLERLAIQLATNVALPISRGRFLVSRLYWSDGVIRAWGYQNDRFQYRENRVTLHGANLPEVLANSLVGRNIDEIVELPMEARLQVRGVELPDSRRIVLYLKDTLRAVDLTSGMIDEAPRPRWLAGSAARHAMRVNL